MRNISTFQVAFDIQEDGEVPVSYREIEWHMVFDIKSNTLARKARFVAGGHMTDPPKDSTYSSVVSSEVGFQRMTRMDGLKDVIPYGNINTLPYMCEWGFAMMNLVRTPLRFPGSDSGVEPSYFDKAKVSL
jgi:hypothetical protein